MLPGRNRFGCLPARGGPERSSPVETRAGLGSGLSSAPSSPGLPASAQPQPEVTGLRPGSYLFSTTAPTFIIDVNKPCAHSLLSPQHLYLREEVTVKSTWVALGVRAGGLCWQCGKGESQACLGSGYSPPDWMPFLGGQLGLL